MIKRLHLYSLFLLVLSATATMAQDKIKVKATNNFLYFYQIGKPADTVSLNQNDLFYMRIAESVKCHLKIEVENGQLIRLKSDTLFQLKRLANMTYIHYYTYTSANEITTSVNQKKCDDYKTATNGVGNRYEPHRIIIRFYNSNKDSLLFTNNFYYK